MRYGHWVAAHAAGTRASAESVAEAPFFSRVVLCATRFFKPNRIPRFRADDSAVAARKALKRSGSFDKLDKLAKSEGCGLRFVLLEGVRRRMTFR